MYPETLYPAPQTLYPATKTPAPCTSISLPCILRPAPCILHPKSCAHNTKYGREGRSLIVGLAVALRTGDRSSCFPCGEITEGSVAVGTPDPGGQEEGDTLSPEFGVGFRG